MPVYNAARYVADAVRSVLSQTYHDFELLVIDDGSADASAAIVAAFADSRIRLVRNDQNMGLSQSLNRGLALARGSLVARQDADDLSEPMRLERQVAYLDATPEVALVGAWYRKVDDAGRCLGERTLPTGDAQLRWAMLYYCPFVHSAVTFRPECVRAVGAYDERFRYGEDFDLWSRLAHRHRMANVPEFLVRYRVSHTSMTATLGADTDQVLRMAVRNIVSVGAPAPTAAEHRAMGALVSSDAGRLQPNEVLPALVQLLDVLNCFVRSRRLTDDEVGRVRDSVVRSATAVILAHAPRLSDPVYLDARARLTRAAPAGEALLPSSRRLAVFRRAVSGAWIGLGRGRGGP